MTDLLHLMGRCAALESARVLEAERADSAEREARRLASLLDAQTLQMARLSVALERAGQAVPAA